MTLADIVFATEMTLLSAESRSASSLRDAGLEPLLGDATRREFPRALAHFERLCRHEAFAPDLQPYLAKMDAGLASPPSGDA